jgi:hypothetical protein
VWHFSCPLNNPCIQIEGELSCQEQEGAVVDAASLKERTTSFKKEESAVDLKKKKKTRLLQQGSCKLMQPRTMRPLKLSRWPGGAASLFRKEQKTLSQQENGTSSRHPVMVETFLETSARGTK